MMNSRELHVIKIGGSVANDRARLTAFLDAFEQVPHPKVLVHGGGSAASELCRKLDIPIRMTDGRRITDEPALEVAVMVYAGLINKQIVARLQARGCNALGLSGADLNAIPARQRSHPTIDFGYVGDIEAETLNTYFIRRLLDEQIVPVFPAITHDGQGQLLNTNADTIAATLAIALAGHYTVELTYCFDKEGVLENPDDDTSVIDSLSRQRYDALKQSGAIAEGMIPKLDTAFGALSRRVQQVRIKGAENLNHHTGTRLIL